LGDGIKQFIYASFYILLIHHSEFRKLR
jgi:hypothetical protein